MIQLQQIVKVRCVGEEGGGRGNEEATQPPHKDLPLHLRKHLPYKCLPPYTLLNNKTRRPVDAIDWKEDLTFINAEMSCSFAKDCFIFKG